MFIIIGAIFLTILYAIYQYVFGANPKNIREDDAMETAKGYESYKEHIHESIRLMKETTFQKMTIMTKDGVQLYGRYYQFQEGAPMVLMFHGYHGNSNHDGIAAFDICMKNRYNLMLVDQRAHKESSGKTITFGVKERYDCVEWIEHIISHFGEDTKLILMGWSMGSATVTMAAGLDLPVNVKGIIADCGYSSPKEILIDVLGQMKLPGKLIYPLVRLSAMLYGGFDPDSASSEEALKHAKIPVLFIHGEGDMFVPYRMSKVNYEACASEKEFFSVPKAGHVMSYWFDTEGYTAKVESFLERNFAK